MGILAGILHIILLAVFLDLAIGSYLEARLTGRSKRYSIKHAILWPVRLRRVRAV